MESFLVCEDGEGVALQHAPFGLRAATETDCDFLWYLTATTMRDYIAKVSGWDEAFQEKRFWCTFDPARWRVLIVDGKNAGGFAIDHHPHVLFLADLQLLPEYQGHGIGSAIIGALTAEARGTGRPLLLQVLDNNPRARRLYERLGFSFVCPSPVPHYSVMVAPS